MPEQPARTRLLTIDIAKGIGISLVVIGHYNVDNVQPQYWLDLRSLIYLFHMPMFMFLSGYLFNDGRPSASSPASYLALIKKKASRLAYPYFCITAILLAMKLAAGAFFKLQFPVDQDLLKYVFLNPGNGFNGGLWFIYTLFVIFLLFPLLQMALRNDWLLIAAAVAASFFPWPWVFCLDLVFKNLPFFALGYVARHYVVPGDVGPRQAAVGLAGGLGLSLAIIWAGQLATGLPGATQATSLLVGTTASLSCIFVASLVSQAAILYRPLAALGLYSNIIYLTHNIPAAPVRFLAFDILRYDVAVFPLTAVVACLGGLVLPLLVQKHFISPTSLVAKYMLGQPAPVGAGGGSAVHLAEQWGLFRRRLG